MSALSLSRESSSSICAPPYLSSFIKSPNSPFLLSLSATVGENWQRCHPHGKWGREREGAGSSREEERNCLALYCTAQLSPPRLLAAHCHSPYGKNPYSLPPSLLCCHFINMEAPPSGHSLFCLLSSHTRTYTHSETTHTKQCFRGGDAISQGPQAQKSNT